MTLLSATIVFLLLVSSSNCRSFEGPISKFHDNTGELTSTETTTAMTYSTVPENDVFLFKDVSPRNADGTTILQTTTTSTLNMVAQGDLTDNQLNGVKVNSDIQRDGTVLEPPTCMDETSAIAKNDNNQFVSDKGSGANHVISKGSNIIYNLGADNTSNQFGATADNEELSANHNISDGSNIIEVICTNNICNQFDIVHNTNNNSIIIGPIARETAHIFIQIIRMFLEFIEQDQTN